MEEKSISIKDYTSNVLFLAYFRQGLPHLLRRFPTFALFGSRGKVTR
jgi:hypothetical protein